MPNSHFSFKQFTIHQDKCAMKVCTDSCLFGAIISSAIINKKTVLDIGSGTGLLSLMYAQKNANATINAVEINEDAYLQSIQNINAAPFLSSIAVSNISIVNFKTTTQYELIFSNPPFFKNNLKSNNEQRNMAMHNDNLSYEMLINCGAKLLLPNGIFAVLLPFAAQKEFIEIAAKQNVFTGTIINVKQTLNHSYFRTILFFTFTKKETTVTEIAIKNNENQYTKEFEGLLKEYYLYL